MRVTGVAFGISEQVGLRRIGVGLSVCEMGRMENGVIRQEVFHEGNQIVFEANVAGAVYS